MTAAAATPPQAGTSILSAPSRRTSCGIEPTAVDEEVRAALTAVAERERAAVLASLAPAIARVGGVEGLASVDTAIGDAAAWWP